MARVCLDPGHGGYDPGAVGISGLKEKDITLAVALEAGSFLTNSGIEVVYTRNSDQVSWPSEVNQDLAGRCRIANQAKADLFISIHCNSAGNPDARGTETYSYTLSDRNQRGVEGSRLVQAELVAALGLQNRGTKTNNFYVLRETVMPAVLTELAFLSNPEEERLLSQPDFRTRASKAIARAVLKFIGLPLADLNQASTGPRLVINGEPALNVPYRIIEGKTYVELVSFVSSLGGQALWDEKTKSINIQIKKSDKA